MAINKEALANLIALQTGNNEFTADMLDDSMLAGLTIEDEVEVDEDVEEADEGSGDSESTEESEEVEVDGDDEDEDPLANIDPNQLSPTERMFYDYIQAEKKKAKQREIALLIQGSQLDIQHKMILDRMAKDGVPRKSIEATIEDFKQIKASSTRIAGPTKIVSKSKTKGTAQTNTKVPKIGTEEFGKYLAQLRQNKKI
ncbi:MAG: hypothetical protein ACRCX2_28340 [Paraclostridium sp.]